MKRALAMVSSLLLPSMAWAGQVRLPDFDRTVLHNGLVVLTMEQHEVPLLEIGLGIRSGASSDPAGKAGTAGLCAAMLRKGTATRTADQISELVDFLGADLGGGAGYDFSSLDMELLAKDAEQGLELMADLVTHPSFPREELDKLRARARDGIRRAKDRPAAVLGRYAAGFYFGPDHPYGRPAGGDESSLAAIHREDLVTFHRTHYVPGNAVLVMVGDLPRKEMLALARASFGSWTPGPPPPKVVPKAPGARPGRVLLVDKPGSPQAHFAFVGPGITRTDPKRIELKVVNTLFGGRFTSWLNEKLRIEEGLTYGARSGFVSRVGPGYFVIRSYTETRNLPKALDMTVALLGRLHREGPTAPELASVRSYLEGQFPTSLETPDDLADILMTMEMYGLGREEVDGFVSRVRAVGLDEARELVARYFPEHRDMVLVVIGEASKLREALEKYGPVTEKKITDPGF